MCEILLWGTSGEQVTLDLVAVYEKQRILSRSYSIQNENMKCCLLYRQLIEINKFKLNY